MTLNTPPDLAVIGSDPLKYLSRYLTVKELLQMAKTSKRLNQIFKGNLEFFKKAFTYTQPSEKTQSLIE